MISVTRSATHRVALFNVCDGLNPLTLRPLAFVYKFICEVSDKINAISRTLRLLFLFCAVSLHSAIANVGKDENRGPGTCVCEKSLKFVMNTSRQSDSSHCIAGVEATCEFVFIVSHTFPITTDHCHFSLSCLTQRAPLLTQAVIKAVAYGCEHYGDKIGPSCKELCFSSKSTFTTNPQLCLCSSASPHRGTYIQSLTPLPDTSTWPA